MVKSKRRLKKSVKQKIVGITLISIGFLTTLFNPKINGFSINEISNNYPYLIPPLFLILIGIILTLSGNSLQEWLGEREKRKKSPTLEKITRDEQIIQTPEEQKEFSRRYSGKKSFWKQLTGKSHVKQIPQKQVISDNSEDYDEKNKFINYTSQEIENTIQSRRRYNQKELERKTEKIIELRKKLIQSKKTIDENAEEGYFSEWAWEDYIKSREKLSELYHEIQIPFNQRNQYDELKEKKAKKGAKKAKKEFEEGIRENKFVVRSGGRASDFDRSIIGFNKQISKEEEREDSDYDIDESTPVSYWGRSILQDLQSNLDETLENNHRGLARLYKKGIIKGMPVSEASSRYHAVFTHSLPNDDTNLSHFRDQIEWNNESLDNYEVQTLKIEDFIQILQKKKPMISASSVSYENKESITTYGPYGVIIKEGDIFDASATDMGSKARSDMLKFRGSGIPYKEDIPIEERVEYAIKNTPRGHHNEFIIGNYELGGLYIREGYKNDRISKISWEDRLKYIAQESIKNNLPLYMLDNEGEFQELNPQEILNPPKKQRIYRTSSTKTTKKPSSRRKAAV